MKHAGYYKVLTNSAQKSFDLTVCVVKEISVKKGDFVTLHNDLTEMKDDDRIQWSFEYGPLIAEINKWANRITVYDDVLDGRFRDRLKLDNQTGSLTITNTGTTHSGVYELDINYMKMIFILNVDDSVHCCGSTEAVIRLVLSALVGVATVILLVYDIRSRRAERDQEQIHTSGVFGDDEVSVIEGNSVTLNSGLTEMKDGDEIRWKFGNENIVIAEINVTADSFTVYDDVLDGRFRDRLKLDNQTGSLTITNTTMKQTGLYKLQNNSLIKSFGLTVFGLRFVTVIERDSVTLNSDLTEMKDEMIQWRFGNTVIAEINKRADSFTVYDDVLDGRFRDRLKLDNQTGSLTITNTRTEHAGVYEQQINHLKTFFILTVIYVIGDTKVMSVMEGDSVTLNTDLTEMMDDGIQWMFGTENTVIAEISVMAEIIPVYDDYDGRFRDRLKLDNQTGSLTITNTTTEHSGLYKVKIIRNIVKLFNLAVCARLPVPVISSNSSQCSSSSSSSCSLVCSAVNVSHVTLSWYKGNSLLSSISVSDLSISLSLPLEVEYQDKNTYSCVLNNTISNQTQHLDITQLCHTCSVTDSVSLIALISAAAAAGSLLIVAAVGIFCICKKCRKTDQEAETREEEITYVETMFFKRKAQKLDDKEEDHVEYAPIANRK
ncbi:uncharacterized protein LOC127520844 isoform X4 [Ctenopharyngodon idella]|uniref:uncharacterized protein LOC127520844 isoform X4 n=1 Tax=Ctenopharyngodon idella TaxID=7959 RepID=UPI0022308659|nr:uncharacterized protein LOC127520844 isoform X4 [Ctenopharyngodon idella]